VGRQEFKDAFQEKYKNFKVKITTADTSENIRAIPTGILSFDIASGMGGFPRGRVVEIFGPESGGKSLLSLASVSYLMRMDPEATTLYFDVEGGTPKEWLTTLNIDLSRFDVVPAGITAEDVLDTIIQAIDKGEYTYIIVDSVAAMIPRAQLEGEVNQNYMAELARAMSKGLNKIVNILPDNGPCVIFINQVREKPGVMYGNPETTPGGKALKFYSAQRYRVTRKSGSEQREKGDVVGHTIKIVNKKNKLGPPYRESEFFINYTEGINTVKNLMSLLKSQKMYEKKGQKYTLTLGDKELSFDKVGDIEEKLQEDKMFHEAVYATLMKSSIGYVGSTSEESLNPFILDDDSEENMDQPTDE